MFVGFGLFVGFVKRTLVGSITREFSFVKCRPVAQVGPSNPDPASRSFLNAAEDSNLLLISALMSVLVITPLLLRSDWSFIRVMDRQQLRNEFFLH